jgi:hypothetical protein
VESSLVERALLVESSARRVLLIRACAFQCRCMTHMHGLSILELYIHPMHAGVLGSSCSCSLELSVGG